jgi:hypothetical protein
MGRCVAEFTRLDQVTSREVIASRCQCVLDKSQHKWSADKFSRILFRISTGAYAYRVTPFGMGPRTTTFPSEMLEMMENCRRP